MVTTYKTPPWPTPYYPRSEEFTIQMAKLSVSLSFLLVLSVFTAGKGCELAVRGGGCPDVNACVAICEPCYRGIGKIRAFCRSAGGGIPFDECICSFSKGAPCNPPAPPKCPGPWPPSQNV
ncbi:hypothetical protein Patl1_25312 [Pistacia atlantica]|uniref:Uncharacterized protein n=1 Tax=Pistacia atlantica TaxID=434234 RepID=A0ACC1B2E4_9ROSI|nr:hypothetical protein Patl1_25312 [Pistacia atlantica]